MMAHQIYRGDIDVVKQEVEASHPRNAIERSREVGGMDIVLVEDFPGGVAHVEHICRPIDGDDEGEHARDRQQHLIYEAIAPFLGDSLAAQVSALGIYAEPSLAAGDGEHAGELHGPPDNNLYGEQGETYPSTDGSYRKDGKRDVGVCLVGTQHLIALPGYHIPLPQGAE